MAPFTARLAAVVAMLGLVSPGGLAAQSRERVAFVAVVDRATGAPLTELTQRDIVISSQTANLTAVCTLVWHTIQPGAAPT